MERWYVARVKVSFPWDIIIEQLKRQSFVSWMPIIRHTSFQWGRKTIIEEPLFGAYLFVQFDIGAQRWRAINRTVGITRLLPELNEFPEPVAHGFVEALQSRPTMAVIEDLTVKYAADNVVKIIAGTFQGEVRQGAVVASGVDPRAAGSVCRARDRGDYPDSRPGGGGGD